MSEIAPIETKIICPDFKASDNLLHQHVANLRQVHYRHFANVMLELEATLEIKDRNDEIYLGWENKPGSYQSVFHYLLPSGESRTRPQLITRGKESNRKFNTVYGFVPGLPNTILENDMVVMKRVYNGPPLKKADLISKKDRLVSTYTVQQLGSFLSRVGQEAESA